ncbi:DUF3277 family protein [Patescibacteria group bacterium]|nr:DUF3277 family protein [Patescibacteria group bacterium]
MKQYSFLNTIVLINAVGITGWAEGDDVIQIERRADSAIDVVGADGEMTVAITADRSAEFRINLQQSSSSNLYLSGLVNAAENGAFVPIFIQFKDTGGNDLASGTQGYIQKPPAMNRGTGINGQQWIIVVERADLLVGGN